MTNIEPHPNPSPVERGFNIFLKSPPYRGGLFTMKLDISAFMRAAPFRRGL